MKLPAPVRLVLLALLRSAGAQPCPSEMNSVKDLLEVNCTAQGLSAVPSALPKDTGILLLGANRLLSVSTAAFLPLAALRDLDLSNNGLAALHAAALLPSLTELVLSHNALPALPALEALPALTHLALAHNRVATLAPRAFHATPRLQYLDLRGNLLKTLPPEAFAGLEALKELDLSDNALQELPPELLQGLRSLESLWLSGNLLQSLPADFFPKGHFFLYVFLAGNPWRCDCELLYLRAWIRQNGVSVYRLERSPEKTKVEVAPESVLCRSPDRHKQEPVVSFKPDCGSVGDADEEEEDEYGYSEVTDEKTAKTASFRLRPTTPEDQLIPAFAVTRSPFAATRAPLASSAGSILTPSTWIATRTARPSAPVGEPTFTLTSTQLARTSPRTSRSSTTFLSTLWTSTRPPGALAPAALTTGAASTRVPLSTGASRTASTVAPCAPAPTACAAAGCPSSPRALPAIPSSTAALPTRPGAARPQRPVPLCPCRTAALRPRAAAEGPPWGQWVLRHCCLLRWALHLAALALLLPSAPALLGWLLWLRAVGRPSWSKPSLRVHKAQYPLLGRGEAAEGPEVHLSSSPAAPQRPTFCTIKEVQWCPGAATSCTYCTVKDLPPRRSPHAGPPFCTTKELWIRHHPLNATLPASRESCNPQTLAC